VLAEVILSGRGNERQAMKNFFKSARVTVVGSKSYAPFFFLDAAGEPAGIWVDTWIQEAHDLNNPITPHILFRKIREKLEGASPGT
jgi:hypothetical protein